MLLENKTLLIHVTCEVVVLGVLIFWVHRRTSNLWEQIEDMSQRLEDQEDKIQNHERIIKEMINMLNSQRVPPAQQSVVKQTKPPHRKPPARKLQKVEEPVEDIEENLLEMNIEEDDFEETESEMDDALKDELAELDVDLSTDDQDVKKN